MNAVQEQQEMIKINYQDVEIEALYQQLEAVLERLEQLEANQNE